MTINQDSHQSFIDTLLLSDDRVKRTLGRLFATEAYREFDQWLDHEQTSSASPADVLHATVMFACFLIADVANIVKRPNSGAEEAILQFATNHLRGILNCGSEKSDDQN